MNLKEQRCFVCIVFVFCFFSIGLRFHGCPSPSLLNLKKIAKFNKLIVLLHSTFSICLTLYLHAVTVDFIATYGMTAAELQLTISTFLPPAGYTCNCSSGDINVVVTYKMSIMQSFFQGIFEASKRPFSVEYLYNVLKCAGGPKSETD